MSASSAVRRALTVVLVAGAVACLQPGSALAHAGLSAPVATSYLAKVAQTPPGIEAKAVDGDQQLWLRADPALNVVVTGLRGEAYLRFAPSGVWVNTHSPTFFLNKPRPEVPPRDAVPGATPLWKRVSAGHTYMWHEDRLHSLAVTVRSGAARQVGTWWVPISVGGRAARITGGLSYSPSPSLIWFWPIIVVAICCGLLLRLRNPRVDAVMGAALTCVTLVAIILARAGRGFYGRPNVSAGQLIEFGIYAAVAVAALCLVASRKWRDTVTAIAAVVGFAVGVGLIPVLTRGFVLSAIPTGLERVAVSATLAGGVSSLLVLILARSTTGKPERARARSRG